MESITVEKLQKAFELYGIETINYKGNKRPKIEIMNQVFKIWEQLGYESRMYMIFLLENYNEVKNK